MNALVDAGTVELDGIVTTTVPEPEVNLIVEYRLLVSGVYVDVATVYTLLILFG